MRGPCAVAILAALFAAVPAQGAWEVMRKNDAVTLAIDPASIKRAGDTVSFLYLIDYAKVDKLRGMNVTFVTTARTDEESKLLLQYLGMPFRNQ